MYSCQFKSDFDYKPASSIDIREAIEDAYPECQDASIALERVYDGHTAHYYDGVRHDIPIVKSAYIYRRR